MSSRKAKDVRTPRAGRPLELCVGDAGDAKRDGAAAVVTGWCCTGCVKRVPMPDLAVGWRWPAYCHAISSNLMIEGHNYIHVDLFRNNRFWLYIDLARKSIIR